MFDSLNLGITEFIILAAASAAMAILWFKSRSPSRYLRDWEAARDAGQHGPAARALETAAGLTRGTDRMDAARMSNEAGLHWLQAGRPQAAVQALKNALTWWGETDTAPDDYHADIVAALERAEAEVAQSGAEAETETAPRMNENELRRRLSLLSGIRNMLWYGGLFIVLILGWKNFISYWWALAPLVANILIYLLMDMMEKRK